MILSRNWIWMSAFLVIVCTAIFFFNRRPKFIVPLSYFRHKRAVAYAILVGIIFLIILLLPLRIGYVTDKKIQTEKIIPIQIVFDVSLSMSANDVFPSRFESAKKAVLLLVQKLDGYEISCITFSGKPFIYIPFSSSTSAITSKLQKMNLGDFPPVKDFLGTALWNALLLAVDNMQNYQSGYKPWIVLLITDGDSNIGFDPLQVMTYYQKMQIPIFAVGVGQDNFLIGRDTFDQEIKTDIDIDLLQKLADTTWGKFKKVVGNQNFDSFFNDIVQSITSQETTNITPQIFYINGYLLRILILCLLGIIGLRFYSFHSSHE